MFAETQFNYGARLLAQAMTRRAPRTWRHVVTRRRPRQADVPGEQLDFLDNFCGDA